MKSIDVKLSTFIDFNVKSNDKDPKFKVGYHVGISKYKNIFAKSYTSNRSEKKLAVKNDKRNCTMDILMEKILLESFLKQNCKRQVQQSLGLKK